MQIEDTALDGVLVVTPRRFADHRGFFSESWNRDALARHGIAVYFVQDNHSFSRQAGTVRGLHFQASPHAQVKLVRCGRGALFDVAVDLRRDSPDYGRWIGVELSFENGRQLLIPEGFAHGFMTLTPETEILYKCSAPYAPQSEGALHWRDPAIGIDWPPCDATVISDRDAAAPGLATFVSPFFRGDRR